MHMAMLKGNTWPDDLYLLIVDSCDYPSFYNVLGYYLTVTELLQSGLLLAFIINIRETTPTIIYIP